MSQISHARLDRTFHPGDSGAHGAPRLRRVALACATLLLPLSAAATNGYFPHGYGIKAKGMGGVSVALSHDSMGGANNPASMAFAGDRLDLGLEWFNPERSASRSGSVPALIDFDSDSGSKHHFVPEFGYSRSLTPQLSAGVTVYGNGGMNTDYPTGATSCGNPAGNVLNGLCGSSRLGVDMMQLIVAPTAAYQVAPGHALGVAPLLAYQRFKVSGLQGFEGMSSSPGSVTDNGYDSSTGFGLRIGYQGRFGPVTLGAAYATQTHMGKFDKYKGLFAEQGGFDIPSHYAVGIAFQATPSLQLAADWMQIRYSDVASVHNPSASSQLLGADAGAGFGWQDVKVLKIGLQWQAMPELVLRAGYNRGSNPVQSADVTFNILAPGVIRSHYTLGGTWQMSPGSELTLAYMRAPEEQVSGASMYNGFPPFNSTPGGGGSETIRMRQQALGVAWALKF